MEKLEFSKSWRNATDFPTYESDETKVRDDLQALHDETRDFINDTLVRGFEDLGLAEAAAGIGAKTVSGEASNVQEVLDELANLIVSGGGSTDILENYYTKLEIDEKLNNQTAIEVLVTAAANAEITATSGDKTVTAQAGEDGNVTMKLPSYGVWTITSEGKTRTLNVTVTQQYTVNLRNNIYGVEWDGTGTTRWVRTDDSAEFSDPVPAVSNGDGSSLFDELLPWSGMKRVTDSAAGELVEIPKFWYKWTKDGSKLKLQIADGPADDFLVSPAHMDRGDGTGERDKVYVGRYHCVSGYKSTTGAAQIVSITRSTARTNIKSLGTGIYQWDFAMHWTIAMLYLVEFADWDSQKVIGYGCSASNAKANNGQTDAMRYHTGTTAASRETYGFCQYRYIEGLWDNVYDWMDGCYYRSNGLHVILNPANFSDTSGGTLVGVPSGGYPTAMNIPTQEGFEWALYPSASGGSDTTYVPDGWSFVGSNPCLFVGGVYGQIRIRGLFFVDCNTVSNSDTSIGSRLQKLP